ncbi:hypothetical protein HYH02_014830 [Chlamydomonas schloesseri]|uniref:Dynamin GTPase domain-containing protein n=1 Tax=Chlamydomonas schloesseri TaxID=2026947 RepID=A0A835VUK4_9CHLO|nr:hypothetical protein HYH02_014830 [Chlamydomonas schloesseri]|eukprot:KAG2426403.1 hypothetical protein HYH02_014830 [Chlamydomonas schloesseri]
MAETKYQKVAACLLHAANQLRGIGVDSYLKVPALVIAGDQSSGKSSVVEALAGVSLPRSDGTCTRCPTEVRMRSNAGSGDGGSAAAWQCRIKLFRNQDSDGKPLSREQLFCTVTDKAHIGAAVTAAQAVLLNPREVGSKALEAERYVPLLASAQPGRPPVQSPAMTQLGDASAYQLQFTNDKVVLEIDGADADLTIIDLPGIIHSHSDPSLIDVVRDMVKSHLAPEHHIIVMTLPAGLDAETQAIRQWVREVDPEGRRSIGVFTKPDKVGEHETIISKKLLDLVASGAPAAPAAAGARAAAAAAAKPDGPHLRLGYYVVKNPGQEQVKEGISFEEAREAEMRYFADHKHWGRQQLRAHGSVAQRLGAKALRDGLSALLVERIAEQLPEMQRSARQQLEALQAELKAMPRPVRNAEHEFMKGLWQIADELAAHTRADMAAGSLAFYQGLQPHYHAYGEGVIRAAPAFLVGTHLISALNFAEKGLGDTPAGKAVAAGDVDLKKLLNGLAAKDSLALLLASGDVEDVEVALQDERMQLQLRHFKFPERYMTLDEVQELRRLHLGRELPGFLPYSAMEALVSRFKGQWHDQAAHCLDNVEAAAQQLAGRVANKHMGNYPLAKRAVGAALRRHVESLVQETAQHLDQLLGCEDRDVFTLNTQDFADKQAAFLGRLKCAYLHLCPPSREDMKEEVHSALSTLSDAGADFPDLDAAIMAQRTPLDEELFMAASCLAYFKVVFSRVRDAVPLAMRDKLLRRLGDRAALEAAVWHELLGGAEAGAKAAAATDDNDGFNFDDGVAKAKAAAAALQEDPHLAERRRHCKAMTLKLQQALELLQTPAGSL